MAAIKYWHTVRHLRPIQVYRRVWFHLTKPERRLRRMTLKGDRRAVALDPAAPGPRSHSGVWRPPIARPISMKSEQDFVFLNEQGTVNSPTDWNTSEKAKLWLYHLHYFDDLNATQAEERRNWHRVLIDHWIAANPEPLGNGWEPYPLSRRIVNWIKWSASGNKLDPEWLNSLAAQMRHLRRRLEWHLLGNHLIANAKALVFAGVFFSGDEADEWRRSGLEILSHELDEQVLADGGHFELSPMYHAIILEDLLDLINLGRLYPDTIASNHLDQWMSTAFKMGTWLRCLSHSDGEIAFFNDAAFGVAASPQEIANYARILELDEAPDPGEGVRHLPASGYIRVQQSDMVGLLDAARIGPDYLPGHGHADCLSFELSLAGRRVLVNSGTSLYSVGAERQRQRSTKAHNTLEVDGENSSEVWASFRVARRAYPSDLAINAGEDVTTISCCHDGYRRLAGRVTHRREWTFSNRALTVRDSLEGDFKSAVIRYFVHPDFEIDGHSTAGQLVCFDGTQITWEVDGGDAQIVSSTWHPQFGLSLDNKAIEIRLNGASCTAKFAWQ